MNLLPLSHMFGQSMATNIPPMVRGTVIFTRSLNPHDVIDLIRARRVSVLVCVPKILDVLREHVVRHLPEAAEAPPAGHFDSRPAGGATGGSTGRLGSNSGRLSWGRPPCPPTSRSSGAGWASPSSRATG